MKASELIAKLQEALAEHGDRDVVFTNEVNSYDVESVSPYDDLFWLT